MLVCAVICLGDLRTYIQITRAFNSHDTKPVDYIIVYPLQLPKGFWPLHLQRSASYYKVLLNCLQGLVKSEEINFENNTCCNICMDVWCEMFKEGKTKCWKKHKENCLFMTFIKWTALYKWRSRGKEQLNSQSYYSQECFWKLICICICSQ